MPFRIILAHCVQEGCINDQNSIPFCNILEQFQHVKNDNVTGFELSCNFAQIRKINMACFYANMVS